MIVVSPSATLKHSDPHGDAALKIIEAIGRVSWKSEGKTTPESAAPFVRMLLKAGHESVIEHVSATVEFIVDRGVTHEIVRHRLSSYTQESTRYCNYNKTGEVVFIKPLFWPEASMEYRLWHEACAVAEETYLGLINMGCSPQEARSVLPNSLKTELWMTCNLREWRHFFKLRTAKAAHPQMREVTIPLLAQFQEAYPVVFEDITPLS